jgi:hypothetical protein
MTAAARSVLVYTIYTFGLGLTLMIAPGIPLPIFGLAVPTDVWIHVAGMTVIFLSIFYYVAARNEMRPFFEASVAIRLAVPFVFAAFIIAGLAPWNLLLLTPLDVLFALWTLVSLRAQPTRTMALSAR